MPIGVFARVPSLENSGRSFKEGEIKLRPESSLYREEPSMYIGEFTLLGASYLWSRGRAMDRLTKETDDTHQTYYCPF
jgi:hypothetical protein